MKKIMTRDEQARKMRRGQLIIGGILISLMVFSTLGYALGGRSDIDVKEVKYKGVKFVQGDSGYWYSNIQGYEFVTKYNPQEIEDISFFSYSSVGDYSNKPLYFVGPGDSISEIFRNLNPFISRVNEVCLDENCSGDFPIKNCSKDNVIVISESLENETEKIYQEDNCVFITASFVNQTKYADAFLFKILGL